MRKLLSWTIGLTLGAVLGASLVMLFAPTSGEQLVRRLKQGWDASIEEARRANEQRRKELEAELSRMQKKAETAVPSR